MGDMRAYLKSILVLILVAASLQPAFPALMKESHPLLSPSNPTGVDVSVTQVSVAYTNSADAAKYKMFSSNHPIIGFNRPAELFAIDGMLNVSVTLTITVENLGSAASGVIDVNVLLLHNEYIYFEFVNESTQMSTLAGGSSNTVSVIITPSYAGNHTMIIRATPTISDDDPTNDALTKRFTVGSSYYNCDSSTAWTFGSGWSMSTDSALSQGRSCHIGNGQGFTYGNNMMTSLLSPVMDLSDAILNPLRTNGFSFFYTGSTATNDKLTMYGRNTFGAWGEIGSISGTIDQTFADGANWQTFSVNNKGATSPILPVVPEHFHKTSQFKFEFTSDASGGDVGFYLDDIVFVYDQKVRPMEYNVSAQGISTNGAIPGQWGSVTLKIINTGNISEVFLPELIGLPTGWHAYFTRPSGTSFDPLDGLLVSPGTPQEFNIMIQPDANASVGFQQMSVIITSQSYTSVTTTLPVQFLVKADRIPVINPPSIRPSCPPSYTCTFEVEMTNIGGATDVFDITIDTSTIPQDWNIALAWTQSPSVLIRPSETVNALFTMTVPTSVAPDTVVGFEMKIQAQNDSSRSDVKEIEVAASMISIASVDLLETMKQATIFVVPGEQISLEFKIWNNATRQDIFSMSVDVQNIGNWVIHQPTRPNAVLNTGASTTFEVLIDVLANAIGGDKGPTITPVIQSERSRMVIEGEPFQIFEVKEIHDVSIMLVEAPTQLMPGIANEASFNLINHGNSDTSVQLDMPNLPLSWEWWITVDSIVHEGPIDLANTYNPGHEQEVSLWFMLPMSEAAGGWHSLEITVQTAIQEEDVNPANNAVEIIASVGSVRDPHLSLGNHSASAMVGEAIFAEATLSNAGNALEDRLSVVASVSSSPPVTGLVSFFTIDGADRVLASPNKVSILGGHEIDLKIEVVLPSTTPLNTRLVLRFEIEGAMDEFGLPIEMAQEVMIMVDQRRSMETHFEKSMGTIIPNGLPATVWVNHTSTSTRTESFVLTVDATEGWQISCNKMLVNQSGLQYELSPGHITPQTRQHICEILRLNGPLDGTVHFSLSSSDAYLSSSSTLAFTFATPPQDSTLSTTTLISGGIGGILFIVFVLTLLRNRSSSSQDQEIIVQQSQLHIGPPVTPTPIVSPIPAPLEGDVGQVRETDAPSTAANVDTTQNADSIADSHEGPPLPEGGLPPGWTEEQWRYYGHQYLDGTL